MRIVFIGPFGLRVKGTMSRRALPMARALAARGHQVGVVLPPWDCPEDSGREWEEEGVGVHHIALPPRFPLLFHLLVTWRLVRRALAVRPEVIHCFKPKAYAGLSATAIWFLQRLGLAKVRLVVDSDDWEGWGGWNEFGHYTWAQKQFFAWQERWGLTHCDAVTVASRTLQTLTWSLGVAPKRVFYVPNGANLQSPIPNPQSPLFSVLLYTRFFEFQAERVIEVFERVAAEVPEVRFLIVGEGLFREEEKLRFLASQRGLADRLVYAGWAEPAELPRYLAAADVAIYLLDDNLLNRARCSAKLVDLMAAGLAIVAEDVGQSSEHIEHGRSGLLVEAGEAEAFARCVVRLLRDEGLRETLGNEARRRVCEEFAWERLIERIESAYQAKGEVHE